MESNSGKSTSDLERFDQRTLGILARGLSQIMPLDKYILLLLFSVVYLLLLVDRKTIWLFSK